VICTLSGSAGLAGGSTDDTRSTVTDPTKSEMASEAVGEDPDSELLKFLRLGLPDAFSTLMHRYSRRLTRVAFRMTRSREDAEDIVQITFLQVYRHIGTFRGDCKLTSWLTRIAINQSLMVLRRRREPEISIDDLVDAGNNYLRHELTASCATPEERLLGKELAEKLLVTLQALREPSRMVAEMHYLHGLSSHEIACAIGISKTAAKSRLLRARRELRRDGARYLSTLSYRSNCAFERGDQRNFVTQKSSGEKRNHHGVEPFEST
jgi:RNA polymerase sigma-70 factor (ECF subfamily)